MVEGAGGAERRTLVRDVLWNWQTAFNAENAENAEDGGIGERQNPVFERIGGYLGLAFYAAQAVALGGGLVVMIAIEKIGGDRREKGKGDVCKHIS